MSSKQHYDVIVIGAGAAGLMCAATAGGRGRRVLVLDSANKVGKKILMSGGGRCNFTNYFIEPDNYLCQNPHFCKSALSRYTQYDFIAMVESHGIAYHEKKLGQLFCDNKSSDILNMLLSECDKSGVEIRTDYKLATVERREAKYCIDKKITCESLVVATGGLSIPTLGSSGLGYDLAAQFELELLDRSASLVPFTLGGDLLQLARELSGVAIDVCVSNDRQSFTEALLFTHRGISGPAILQISNYWRPGEQVSIDFLPGTDLAEQLNEWRSQGKNSSVKNLLSEFFAKRFVTLWLEREAPGIQDKTLQQLSNEQLQQLVSSFKQWTFLPAGTEGYKTAEVTLGGVNTDEVSSKTFESKKAPGLYFIGEVLDVTGWLGGYNFQWAWSSGWCAAQYV